MSGFEHSSVMLQEALAGLNLRRGGCYVDGTIGGAGHAEAILEALGPEGRLYGCDRDATAVRAALKRLAKYAGRCEIRQGSFAELGAWIPAATCDGAILDLGVSSPQLDRPERGFSILRDGPLDMRMDVRDTTTATAAQIVNESDPEELARIFLNLGGERHARRIARAIAKERQVRPIETTGHLAGLIERVVPNKGRKIHPATQVFQALRVAVNRELEELEKGLPVLWSLLKSGGRLVTISFHSLEDGLVKAFGRRLARNYEFEGDVDVPELRRPAKPQLRWVHRKAISPSRAEILANPRSRSARLRIMEKI